MSIPSSVALAIVVAVALSIVYLNVTTWLASRKAAAVFDAAYSYLTVE
jgi:hypothetical protein